MEKWSDRSLIQLAILLPVMAVVSGFLSGIEYSYNGNGDRISAVIGVLVTLLISIVGTTRIAKELLRRNGSIKRP